MGLWARLKCKDINVISYQVKASQELNRTGGTTWKVMNSFELELSRGDLLCCEGGRSMGAGAASLAEEARDEFDVRGRT